MDKKNIIFYFSDQQRWDTVNEEITPNLTALAEDGVLFEKQLHLSACMRTCKGLPAIGTVCHTNRMLLERNTSARGHTEFGSLL